MLEQVTLPRLVGRRGRVHEVDDVTEPEPARGGVVLEQAALVVQPGNGIGDAALDRLRHGPAVGGRPVRQRLAGLVGPLQHRRHQLPPARQARAEQRVRRVERADERRRPHVRARAQPTEEARGPVGIGDGHGLDEAAEPPVAVGRLLVERVLADDVGDGEQEQLALRVVRVSRAALVGDAGRGRLGDDRAARPRLHAVELAHVRPLLPASS
ncbi:hypothetical protein [Virgisporangium aurantiacum]|uniref:hypothetical protein n=1 Tax=Virgisporangium aurantiacum TaxID=175570 RepID=UPI001EF1E45C|nr:hypothetical protein [Virgisporangium aurantiacum]